MAFHKLATWFGKKGVCGLKKRKSRISSNVSPAIMHAEMILENQSGN